MTDSTSTVGGEKIVTVMMSQEDFARYENHKSDHDALRKAVGKLLKITEDYIRSAGWIALETEKTIESLRRLLGGKE